MASNLLQPLFEPLFRPLFAKPADVRRIGNALDGWRAGSTYGDWNPADLSRLFQDDEGTTPVEADNDPVGLLLDSGPGGFDAAQSTDNSRPSYQAGYLRGDGTADNLLTTYTCSTGANTVIAKRIVPASISATQVVFGMTGAGDTRFYLGFSTGGLVVGGVGAQGTATIAGTTDLRSKTAVVALTIDGSTVKLFAYVDGAASEEYSAAQSGNPADDNACRILAFNASAGTASTFATGDLGRVIAAQKSLSIVEFTAIAAQLMAA